MIKELAPQWSAILVALITAGVAIFVRYRDSRDKEETREQTNEEKHIQRQDARISFLENANATLREALDKAHNELQLYQAYIYYVAGMVALGKGGEIIPFKDYKDSYY